MKPVIETHALCKSYHSRPVVDHLNLTVPEGCVYGFLGPNGAGKSTTMKMLLGLVHPTGGSVELLGHTLNEANRIALLRQTGSLIESPSGYLHLTARENLSIVADLKDVDRKDISRVLEIVHLTKDADRKVGQYSLGMKQRLGIAMALLGSPKLLILDEPTNGLDPAGIQEMRSLIASMPQTTGATVLISSHLLARSSRWWISGHPEPRQTAVRGFSAATAKAQPGRHSAAGAGCTQSRSRPAAAGSKSRCTGRPAGHPAAAPAAGRSAGGTGLHPCRKRRGCGGSDCADKEP